MRLRMLNRKVLIKPDPEEYQHENEDVNKALKEGKLFLPEDVQGFIKKVAKSGTIIDAAPDCKTGVKAGDRVIFGQFAFEKTTVNDEVFWIMNEIDLHCSIED